MPLRAPAAELPAIVTLLEGPASLLRGTTRYNLVEGVRLHSGDIVELAGHGLAQIEFADGAAISLGPNSRFYAHTIASRGAKAGAPSDFYLLRGWIKFTHGKSAAPLRLTTLLAGLITADATAVLNLAEHDASLFVESGEVRLAEGFGKAATTAPIRVRAGQFYARKADQKGVVQPRPAATFVAAMPKPYLDNLPMRAAKYKDREVAPRRVEEVDYADMELWLKGPAEIRRSIMPRFLGKAEDPAFRQAVIANMRFHPEWDRVLFPEKYLPKPPPEPPKVASPPPAAAPAPAPAAPAAAQAPPAAAPATAPIPAAAPAPPSPPVKAVRAAEKPVPLPPVTVEDAGPDRPARSE